MENYYDILGIGQTGDMNIIKAAYKKKIILFHPDKNKNDKNCVEKFIKIKRAYEFLSDSEKKKEFDEKLKIVNIKRQYENQRKFMIKNLKKREKESKKELETNNNLNKKRYRDYYRSDHPHPNDLQKDNTSNECLKLKFKTENEIDFSDSIIQAYFREYGKIENIIIEKKKNVAYVKYENYINVDNIIAEAENNKGTQVLFTVEKEKWYKVKNKKEVDKEEEDTKDKIKNIKIINETNKNSNLNNNNTIDLASISLENLEDEIFK